MATSNTSPPSYWVHKIPHAYQKCFLEDDKLSKSSICAIIKSTWDSSKVGAGQDAEHLRHSDIEIIKVERAENIDLFYSYSHRRQELEKRGRHCPGVWDIPKQLADFNKEDRRTAVNEYYLFHGTDTAVSIASTGFQTRFADPENLFGKAIYFTDSFQKADQYSDKAENRAPPGTELTVIMARVLLGNTYKCDKKDAIKLKRLPCTQHTGTCQCGPLQRYDSVESTDLLFREFAVYEGTRCYPEYIITYKRTGKQIEKQTKLARRGSITGGNIWQQTVRSVNAIVDRHEQLNDISKVYMFCQKTKIEPPVFVFNEDSHSVENRWKCTCNIHCPIEATAISTCSRKKIAKRLAAKQIWEELENL